MTFIHQFLSFKGWSQFCSLGDGGWGLTSCYIFCWSWSTKIQQRTTEYGWGQSTIDLGKNTLKLSIVLSFSFILLHSFCLLAFEYVGLFAQGKNEVHSFPTDVLPYRLTPASPFQWEKFPWIYPEYSVLFWEYVTKAYSINYRKIVDWEKGKGAWEDHLEFFFQWPKVTLKENRASGCFAKNNRSDSSFLCPKLGSPFSRQVSKSDRGVNQWGNAPSLALNSTTWAAGTIITCGKLKQAWTPSPVPWALSIKAVKLWPREPSLSEPQTTPRVAAGATTVRLVWLLDPQLSRNESTGVESASWKLVGPPRGKWASVSELLLLAIGEQSEIRTEGFRTLCFHSTVV